MTRIKTNKIDAKTAKGWAKLLTAYQKPNTLRAFFDFLLTFSLFIGFFSLALWATHISYLLAIGLAIITGGFFVRLFVIQHDCAHQSYFHTKHANQLLGHFISFFTVTPYHVWRAEHLAHHARQGHVDARGVGDVPTLSIDEYKNLSSASQFIYRLERNPFIRFTIAPILVFLIYYRLPLGTMKKHFNYTLSVIITNIGMALFISIGIYIFGWLPFIVVYLCAGTIGAAGGAWLTYLQHQFDNAYWEPDENWNFHEAALSTSTYYVLPVFFRWLVGNINIHHAHHLCSLIPSYRLAQVLEDYPALQNINPITTSESLRATRLKLWDPQKNRLVSYQEAGL